MVKLRTGRLVQACICATISDESTPPERKAPIGTSAIMRPRTASRSRSSSPAAASSAVRLRRGACAIASESRQ